MECEARRSIPIHVRARNIHHIFMLSSDSKVFAVISSLIASPRRPSTSAGPGFRAPVHSESLSHGSAVRIRRARAPSS